MKKKTLKSKRFFFISISIFSLIFIIGIVLPITGFEPFPEEETYIVSNDLVKNFLFETFDGRAVSISGQTLDQKLQFESQASWNIYPEDISLLNVYTEDDNAYIRYKVAMTSKINMYTTLDVYQCAENNLLQQIEDRYRIAVYTHCNAFGGTLYSWDSHITWDHYDFGNIKQWNSENNDFEGDLVMSFDIAQNLLPNFQTISGDTLIKNFDYIAVSSVAVVDNVYGKLDDSVPDIVGITPREYDTGTLNIKDAEIVPNGNTELVFLWDTNIELDVHPDPLNSFDGGLLPQTAESTMNPRTKSGDLIWDLKDDQTSMTDCRIIYHIGSISPLVTEYFATLSFTERHVATQKYYLIFPIPIFGITTTYDDRWDQTYTEPVALHCTNRYIQAKIRVVFDIFCSYKIDVGSDNIEDYNLEFPAEYYDLLLWLTTVDGFGGGETKTTVPDLFGDIFTWIMVIVIVVGGIILFIFVGVPIIKGRQRRKELETILKGR